MIKDKIKNIAINKTNGKLNPKTNPRQYGRLTVDVYRLDGNLVVESVLAAVRPEDIEIDITNDSVTIKGNRRREAEVPEENFLYQEIFWGPFMRTIILPQDINPDQSTAVLKNGALIITMPTLQPHKSKHLKIEELTED